MKAFFIGVIFFVIAFLGAYVGLKYFYKPAARPQIYTTAVMTKTGILQKSTIAQSNFTHVIVSSGTSVGIATYQPKINLDDYIGKNVSVTGQYSGNTLYADTIKLVQ